MKTKTTEIYYERKVSPRQYETETVGITIQVGDDHTAKEALDLAKRFVNANLPVNDR